METLSLLNQLKMQMNGQKVRDSKECVMKTANGELNAFTFVSTQVCLYYMLYC